MTIVVAKAHVSKTVEGIWPIFYCLNTRQQSAIIMAIWKDTEIRMTVGWLTWKISFFITISTFLHGRSRCNYLWLIYLVYARPLLFKVLNFFISKPFYFLYILQMKEDYKSYCKKRYLLLFYVKTFDTYFLFSLLRCVPLLS